MRALTELEAQSFFNLKETLIEFELLNYGDLLSSFIVDDNFLKAFPESYTEFFDFNDDSDYSTIKCKLCDQRLSTIFNLIMVYYDALDINFESKKQHILHRRFTYRQIDIPKNHHSTITIRPETSFKDLVNALISKNLWTDEFKLFMEMQ